MKQPYLILIAIAWSAVCRSYAADRSYCIIDTGQNRCYDNYKAIVPPDPNESFFGQDAQYQGLQPAYKDNGDGTITDLNTSLIWVKTRGVKVAWQEALAAAKTCRIGGWNDWRMPTVKELYSLINFNGGFHPEGGSTPYLDTRYFDFAYGNEAQGERLIDCQDWSATEYAGNAGQQEAKVFGVNFADGRIKAYPQYQPRAKNRPNKLYVRYVRGNRDYGVNRLNDNGDGTITDNAAGLMWSQADSQIGMKWQDALAWVQKKNQEKYLGHSDWRLPNAKELQSIVDYTRAPQAAAAALQGPAIDPIFQISKLPDGEYPFFWTGTTHLDGPRDRQGAAAVYLAFGRALGWMPSFPNAPRAPDRNKKRPPETASPRQPRQDGKPHPPFHPGPENLPSPDAAASAPYTLLDIHGAGAQRSDPKTGDPNEFPHGRGPQGDVIRIFNFVRCVRSVSQ